MDARTLAEQIIRKIGDASTELIITRNGLEDESLGENGMEMTIPEVKEDLFNVLMGHDTGCIDPEDLSAENCEVLWLESKLGEFREQSWVKITDDPNSLPQQFEQVLCCLRKVDFPRTRYTLGWHKRGIWFGLICEFDGTAKSGEIPEGEITHWQLLPAPPEADTQ